MSKYCREEVIKHFDMHTSTVQSHPPHQSCTRTDTCSVTPGCPCCWSGKKNDQPYQKMLCMLACIYGCSVLCTRSQVVNEPPIYARANYRSLSLTISPNTWIQQLFGDSVSKFRDCEQWFSHLQPVHTHRRNI